jgi:hypothetical protein
MCPFPPLLSTSLDKKKMHITTLNDFEHVPAFLSGFWGELTRVARNEGLF